MYRIEELDVLTEGMDAYFGAWKPCKKVQIAFSMGNVGKICIFCSLKIWRWTRIRIQLKAWLRIGFCESRPDAFSYLLTSFLPTYSIIKLAEKKKNSVSLPIRLTASRTCYFPQCSFNFCFFAYLICLLFNQISMSVGVTMVKNVNLYEFSYIIRYFPLHPTRRKTFAVHKYLLITIHKRSNVGLFCLFSGCKLGYDDFVNLLSTV